MFCVQSSGRRCASTAVSCGRIPFCDCKITVVSNTTEKSFFPLILSQFLFCNSEDKDVRFQPNWLSKFTSPDQEMPIRQDAMPYAREKASLRSNISVVRDAAENSFEFT